MDTPLVALLVPHTDLALVLDLGPDLDLALAPHTVLALVLDPTHGLDLVPTPIPTTDTLALPLQALTHGLDLVPIPTLTTDTLVLPLQAPTHGLLDPKAALLGLPQAPGPLKTVVAPGKREAMVVLVVDLVLDLDLGLALALPLPVLHPGDNHQTMDGPLALKDVVVTLVDGVVELLDGDQPLPTIKVGEWPQETIPLLNLTTLSSNGGLKMDDLLVLILDLFLCKMELSSRSPIPLLLEPNTLESFQKTLPSLLS